MEYFTKQSKMQANHDNLPEFLDKKTFDLRI